MEAFFEQIYFYQIIALLAGLGVFMVGMKMMSDSMEKLADNHMRSLFNRISNNRFMGVGVGAAATAIIQSSSATTVMVVGFVNAGVMTLTQAASVIMGANIGTTITAQIASLQAFKITEIATLLAFIGIFITFFAKNDRKRAFATVMAGLGLLFVGLGYMSTAMSSLKDSPFFANVVSTVSNPAILLLAGMLFTALVQSSSAVTGILITMATGGVVIGGGGNAVLYVILGTNVGTCITALLSMIGTNTNAKRAAIIHLLFNVGGALLFTIFLLLLPNFMDATFAAWFPRSPAMQIAMFHTFFNVVVTILLLPFRDYLVKLSQLIVRDKPSEEKRLKFLDERFLKSPSVAVAQLIKEIGSMARMSGEGLELAVKGFLEKDESQSVKVVEIKTEVEFLSQEITRYIVRLSAEDMSYQDEQTVGSMYHVVSDIERISDLSYNITRYTDTAVSENLAFSDVVANDIKEMLNKVTLLFRDSIYAFENRYEGMIPEIDRREDEIDSMKKQLVTNHIKRLNEGECAPNSSSVFVNLVGNLERVGDHLTYIAHSILNED